MADKVLLAIRKAAAVDQLQQITNADVSTHKDGAIRHVENLEHLVKACKRMEKALKKKAKANELDGGGDREV